jgi:hypothetical protein
MYQVAKQEQQQEAGKKPKKGWDGGGKAVCTPETNCTEVVSEITTSFSSGWEWGSGQLRI